MAGRSTLPERKPRGQRHTPEEQKAAFLRIYEKRTGKPWTPPTGARNTMMQDWLAKRPRS